MSGWSEEQRRNADTALQLEEAARELVDFVNCVEVYAVGENADNALQAWIFDLEIALTEAEAARRKRGA